MMASASAGPRRLPRPSAVSASPSRCSPPVSSATSATASTAPSRRRGPESPAAPTPAATPPPSAPSRSPTAGIHSTARAASPGPNSPSVPAGITVNKLSAFRQAGKRLTRWPASLDPLRDAGHAIPDLLAFGGDPRVQHPEFVAVPDTGGGGGHDPGPD